MTKPALSCAVITPLSEVVGLMRLRECGFVPVVEQGTRKLIGVVTDRDICLAAVNNKEPLSKMTVDAAMATPVYSVNQDDDLTAVHDTMRLHHVRRVPVIDAKGCLAGIVSIDDLARFAIRLGGIGVLHQLGETLGQICMPRPLLHA
jgi:CBS domain-containing protein